MSDDALYEVVMKLVGPIRAVGDSRIDAERLVNLKNLTGLVEKLLSEIQGASTTADRPEHSMKVIGMHAQDFIKEIRW